MSKTFKSEGIVLKSLKYSETSLILDIYSKEKGLCSFIVSGVRKAKSKMTNVYKPMNLIDFIAYNADNKLSRIKEASYAYSYEALNLDVIKSSIGIFLIDLARSCIKEREQNEALYLFLKNELIRLDQTEGSIALLPLKYCISMASHLGFSLNNNFNIDTKFFDLESGGFMDNNLRKRYLLSEELSLHMHHLLSDSIEPALSKSERGQLLDQLINFFKIHIDGFKDLRSLSVLRTILS